jgi:hypothetical protein
LADKPSGLDMEDFLPVRNLSKLKLFISAQLMLFLLTVLRFVLEYFCFILVKY